MVISKDRIRKLDKNGKKMYNVDPPTDFLSELMNNRKKRIVVYHKVYRWLYPKVKSGPRVILPSCVVGKVRTTYPDEQYEEDEDLI